MQHSPQKQRDTSLSTICSMKMGLALLCLCLACPTVSAQEVDFTELSIEELSTIKVVANPASVLTSHLHNAGEWMVTYRYRRMNMKGNRDGANALSSAEVLAQFPVTPLEMRMDMHMFSAMYAPTDAVTLMAMLPYKKLSMDHLTRSGSRFTTHSEGFGDLQTLANIVVFRSPNGTDRTNLTLGMSIPVGSINKKDATPLGPSEALPYPMQLGSGTYDLIAGLAHSKFFDRTAWGTQANYRARLGNNDRDYSLGDTVQVQTWLSYGWTPWLSSTLRLDGQKWQNIDGADPALNPLMVPTADPGRRAGRRLDLLLEFELYAAAGKWQGHHLSIESGLPLYQSLDGPQLESKLQVGVSWQWQF